MGSGSVRQCLRDTTPYLFLVMTITTIGPLLFGFHLAELNAPQEVITCKKESIAKSTTVNLLGIASLPQCIDMDDAQFAMVCSIFTLGGLVGALCAGPISTSRGRWLAMQLATVFAILGGGVESVAPSIPVFCAGRLLAGVGAGCSLVVVPLYISEIAPPQERGLFGVMTQITINLGLLIAQLLGYFLSRGSLWRIILAASSAIGALQFIALFFVPESPAWTAANGDSRTARLVLQRIRGRSTNIEDEIDAWDMSTDADALGETQALLEDPEVTARRASKSVNKSHVGFFELIRDPFYRPAIIAVIGVMVAQQFTGINSVMMYSVALFSDLFPTSSALITISITVVNFVVTILCAPLPDMLGRKMCILVSIAGMGSSAAALACSIYFSIQMLSVVAVLFFVSFFAVGLGPIPFILASELVGQDARGATQSWALGANWIATFMIAQFFPMINVALGGRGLAYFIIAGFAVLAGIFVFWAVPESKGKKDADEVWGRVKHVD